MKRRRKEPPSTPFDANGPRRTVSATPTVTPSEDWPQTFEQIRSRTFKRSFAGYDRSQLQLFLAVAADLIDSLERGSTGSHGVHDIGELLEPDPAVEASG